ncbi:MAG: ABC transporter ATP-binding protein [Alphaproteobacteria bacterium]
MVVGAIDRPAADDAIVLRSVVKSFGGIRAVRNCSIRVRRGSVTGLIGPNGAGKSTLFNIIAGLYAPDGGEILLEGRSIAGRRPHEIYHLGLARTFQIAREFTSLTVLENLMVPPPGQIGERLWWAFTRWRAIREQEQALKMRAQEVLAFLKLDHLAHEPAGSLSGGQKKLLELGRVMMSDCRVVLLDEIGAGVNRVLLAELAGLIERLNRDRGYTFCVIEHDMDMIARLCDPVIVMAEGTVLAEGTMQQIRADRRVIEAYLGGSPPAPGSDGPPDGAAVRDGGPAGAWVPV